MAILPLWCNIKMRTKRINRWINNSGPCNQLQQVSLWFLFSVSFTCTIFFSLTYPRTWVSPQKQQPWQWTIYFYLRIVYSIYNQYLEFPGKYHCGRRVTSHKLVITRDDLQQYKNETHRKDQQQIDSNFSGLPTYDLRSLGYII